MGAGGPSKETGAAPVTGAAQPAAADKPVAHKQEMAEVDVVTSFLSGYDSDIDNQLGRKYAGRREVVEKADGIGQFLAVKPWAGSIFPPTGWTDSKNNPTAPEAKLDLEWVYGYRGFDSQDNAFYLKTGEIVYPAAAAGIVLDKTKGHQKHYLQHDDDIVAAAIHPNGLIVATAQVGKDPKICLWNPATLDTIGIIHKAFKRAVTCLAFSEDGNRIVAADLDEKHTISVFEIKGEQINKIASKESGGDVILGLKFNPKDPNQFVSIGKSTTTFWSLSGATLADKRGIVGTVAPLQPFLSVAFLPSGVAITGTASGQVYIWGANGSNTLAKAVQAHQASVFAIHATSSAIWTAGKDGKLKRWDHAMSSCQKVFDLRDICGSFQDSMGRPSVAAGGKAGVPLAKSIFVQNGKILVGTSTCELLEIDEASGESQLITQGHSSGEVWGLAVNPKKPEFVTTSEDSTLRIWDLKARKMLSLRALASASSSSDYSPDGSLIAAGHDNGGVSVLKSDTLELVKSWKDRKECIGEMKFSPNGRMLAVGSNDNFIDLYDVTRDFKRIATCSGHSSYITHFDWSKDGEYLRSNCGAYELLFWKTRTGQQITEAKKMADVKWASNTCILGWQVQGIWPKCADGTDINSVDTDHLGDVLVTADDFGMVNLFRYPVPKPGAECKRYGGHSAHVTCCRFSFDDKHLITTGGGDKTIFQWRLVDESVGKNPVEADDVIAELEATDYTNNRSFKPAVAHQEPHVEVAASEYCSLPDEDEPAISAEGEGPREKGKPSLPGTWFTAVRPWLGAIFPPTEIPESNGEAPAAKVQLEFVYGYRGHDARENLGFLASGEVVYSAAGVGVVMHPSTRRQRFFFGHDDDIVSLTIHPDGKHVATGQVGKDPAIIIWDSATMKAVKVLKGIHQRAVTSLGFSPDGKKLVSVGLDDYHTIAVWDWENSKVLASTRGSTEKIFDINFSPFDPNVIITCGVKHVNFWTLEGGNLKSNKGLMSTIGKLQTMHCMAFPLPDVSLVGAAEGEIYHFMGNKLTNVIKDAHKGGVTAIFSSKEGLITGGNDGLLKTWTLEKNGVPALKETISLESLAHETAEKVLSIRSISRSENFILAGTTSGEVIIVDPATKNSFILVQGLSTGEVWGLAAHPKEPRFVTAAEDKTVRLWDSALNRQIGIAAIAQKAIAADFNPHGDTIAIGNEDGSVSIIEGGNSEPWTASSAGKRKPDSLKILKTFKERKEMISVVRFSPDGTKLAVGSHDNFIDIYEVAADYKKLGTLVGHASYITHLDWSVDGKYMQSNCGAYELLFWDTHTCSQITRPSKLADVKWATWTCVLGWPVQGIWPRGANGTDINSVARSAQGDLLASGDDFGNLKIFKYPAVKPGSQSLKFIGHSAHVTSVAWMHGDNTLITTGGGDRCVFQWSVTK